MTEQAPAGGGGGGGGPGAAPADNRANSPFLPERPSAREYDAMPIADRGRYSQIRRPDSVAEFDWIRSDTIGKQRGDAQPRHTEKPQSIFAAPPDPNATKIKIGADEFLESDVREALKLKTEREARKANGVDPANYRVELPADFQKPAGLDYMIDVSNPATAGAVAEARAFAAEFDINEAGFQKLLSIYAGLKFAETAQIQQAFEREKTALGTAGPARITTISNWLDAMGAGEAKRMLVTSKIVGAIETLMQRHSSQGAAGPGTGHRDAPRAPGMTDEQWAGMTFAERTAYAAQHDQSQFRR